MPLHTKHRPQTLEEFVGNETMIKSLKSVLRGEDAQHTFLLTGPSGCGKTTLARIIKNELNCSDYDFRQFNASNTRGIDTVREVLDEMALAPMKGKVKIYFFDECHSLTKPAQEALLKDTEQPPSHVYFIFCTTEPDKLKETFTRRGFQGEVKRFVRGEIVSLLNSVLEKELDPEDFKSYPQKIISKIAMVCNGSPGQALKILDSIIDIADNDEAYHAVEVATASEASTQELNRAIADQRMGFKAKWPRVQSLLRDISAEPEALRKGILTYLEKIMYGNSASMEIVEMIEIFSDSCMYSYKAGLIAMCYHACLLSKDE